jgi:hypothetical protein
MAVCEWSPVPEPDLYRDGICQLVLEWRNCIDVLGDCVGQQRCWLGQFNCVEHPNDFLCNFRGNLAECPNDML